MRILVFLFLLSPCLIYYGNAASNMNQIKTGGEMEQDPNDPKYQKMAEELVRNNLRIKEEDIQKIKVNSVSTQVVAGIITRIEIRITLISGISDQCNFKVWEQPWANVKHVTYKCLTLSNKKLLSGNSGIPRPEQIRDPKDPKYHKLAKASIDYLFKTPEHKPFEKEEVDRIYVTNVKAQIGTKIKSYIHFYIVTVHNKKVKCTSNITETPWNPEEKEKVTEVTCSLADEQGPIQVQQHLKNPVGSVLKLKQEKIPGGETYEKPWDPKYKKLAIFSFEKYQISHNLNIEVKSIEVDSVTSQIVAGKIIRIHFHVFPTKVELPTYQCKSEIFKGLDSDLNIDINVNCTHVVAGGEEEQDPNDPQYQQLAKLSFERYQNSHKYVKVHVKNINVNRVTLQIVAGTITRINFLVYPTKGNTYRCKSKIFKALGPNTILKFNVNCSNSIPGGETVQDPDDPKYQELAKLSFEWYKNSHKNVKARVKRIKVNRVTTQEVAGRITRINFLVYPTEGNTYECQSKIFEALGLDSKLNFNVHCSNAIPGGETVQDPNDPKYQTLAKLSFEWYLNSHKNVKARVNRIKVNRVTTQEVAGTITRINFLVYPTEGNTYECQSKIFKALGPDPKLNFNVNCDNTVPGGEKEQDPDDPKYQELAKLSFEWYKNSHKNVKARVKRIKVNRVTTQEVAGTITRIYFRVNPTIGTPLTCFSKIFKSVGIKNHDMKFDVSCNLIYGSEVEEDPDDPQYQPLAKKSFEWYLKWHKNVKAHVKSIKINRVTSQLVAGTIIRIHFRVHPTRGSQFECYSKIFKGLGPHPNLDLDVICDTITGGEVEEDPDDPQYQPLAKESFQWYLNSHKNAKVHVKSIEINSVTSQVVAGKIIRMHFLVHPTRGGIFECKSKIDEGLGPAPNIVFHVTCETITGGEVEEDPDDPQYQPLAQESFQWYLNSHPNKNVRVKSIKIDSVTSQVVAGMIIRMYFRVHPTRGSMFMCRSKIFEGLGQGRNFQFDVSCDSIVGGEVEEDPNDPQYKKLAQESFLWYQKSHKNVGYAKSIEVESVTSQIVAGTIIRIHFGVIPSRGSRLKCYSKIFESLGSPRKLDFEVSCSRYDGGEEERDPDEPQFLQLAKESFRKYRETHDTPLIAIRKMQVTRATTQIVAGVITRLNFYVITTKDVKYMCYSTIFEQAWKDHKTIKVDCNPRTGNNKKLTLKLYPMSKTEKFVSNAIKEYFQNAAASLRTIVDRCETTSVQRVTTHVTKQRITYYQVDAFTHTLKGDYAIFNCSVLTGSWFGKKPFSTNCIKLNWLFGRNEWADPTNKKYLSYAEKSLQLHLESSSEVVGPRDYTKYDIIVTFVVLGHAAGYVYNIDFSARWVHGRDDDPTVLLCKSKYWEKPYGENEIVNVKCEIVSWDGNIL